MKNSMLIIVAVILQYGCSSAAVVQSNNSIAIADSLFADHLSFMDTYVAEYEQLIQNCKTCAYPKEGIIVSIRFLAKNTGIQNTELYKSFAGAGFMSFEDASTCLSKWKSWYNHHKGRLRWNESLQKVEVIE